MLPKEIKSLIIEFVTIPEREKKLMKSINALSHGWRNREYWNIPQLPDNQVFNWFFDNYMYCECNVTHEYRCCCLNQEYLYPPLRAFQYRTWWEIAELENES